MTTPFWCLLVVAVLPYLLANMGGYFKFKQFGNLDNNHPRLQAARLEGIGARALAAQMNAWEALSVFATAVFMAHLAHANAEASATAAMVFTATRFAHPVLYLADLATPRTIVFLVGLGSLGRLFYLAATA